MSNTLKIQASLEPQTIRYAPQCFKHLKMQIQELISNSGNYGTVYKACIKHRCNYAIKMVAIIDRDHHQYSDNVLDGGSENIADFVRETSIYTHMAALRLAPNVYDIGICENLNYTDPSTDVARVGYILTDAWDMTLKEYIKKYPELDLLNDNSFLSKLLAKCDILKKWIVVHDLHLGNIVLKVTTMSKIADIAFIDFGHAFYVNESKNRQNIYAKVLHEIEMLYKRMGLHGFADAPAEDLY